MRIDQKSLRAMALLALLVMAIGGAVLVAAQDAPSPTDNPVAEIEDEAGEIETTASASDAVLTEAEAVAIAEGERGSVARFIELEREGGLVVYSIELEDGSEVEVDATTGDILEIEEPGTDDD